MPGRRGVRGSPDGNGSTTARSSLGRGAAAGFALGVATTVVVLPATVGKDLHLKLDQFECLEIGGERIDNEVKRQRLGPLLAMTSAIPTVVIDSDGQL